MVRERASIPRPQTPADGLATEDGRLMAERDDLKLRAAAELACDRGRERREKRVHTGDVAAAKQKTRTFSTRAGFSVGSTGEA